MKILKCGKLFDAAAGTVLENMAVCIEGNKVSAVKPMADVCTEGHEVIDLSDKFVMPGLIDTHVHTMSDGSPAAWNITTTGLEGDVAFESYKNAMKDLMAGFTTIRDESSAHFADVALRDAINAGKVDGPRMFVSGISITATGGHADGRLAPFIHDNGNSCFTCNNENETRRAARMNFKYGADQIKIMATGGVASHGDDPNASEFTVEEMKAAIDVAKEVGKLSSAHAHGCNGIKNAIKAGIHSIEHGMLIDQEGMDMLIEHGTWLVPTIVAAKNIVIFGEGGALPAWMVEKAKLVLVGHQKQLMYLRSKGAKIAFGTDAGTGFNFHGEQGVEFQNMLEFGFEPVEILQSATVKAAQLLKWEDRVGQLKEGYFADVVAFDSNPLEDMTVMTKSSFVMKDGRVYKG